MTRREIDEEASIQLGVNFDIEVLTRRRRYLQFNQAVSSWCEETRCLWGEVKLNIASGVFEYQWPDDLIEINKVFYRRGSSEIDDVELAFVPYDRWMRSNEGFTGEPYCWTARGAQVTAAASPYLGPLMIGPKPSRTIANGLRLVGHLLYPKLDVTSAETDIEAGAAGGELAAEIIANDKVLPFPRVHFMGLVYGTALRYAIVDADNPVSNARIPYLQANYSAEVKRIQDIVADPGNEPFVIGGDYLRGRRYDVEGDIPLPPGYSIYPYRG